ncbi:hypothetical protein [Mycolicibacterium smegmatis]|uniref:hypothetical protein n=1 Tax=Mycolicibacterium smegmatis TaxID=1772 RepID=UPI001EFAC537|nr:hypothetical protein [Mycolicibacterium smegmatis]ULN35235.1 hypothetical protein KZ781_31825 [Mycolicibacterium smegmatis]
MDLTWWIVAIVGCVALAACVMAALLWRRDETLGDLRPLANTARLTGLPEYVRAVRMRVLSACATAALLVVAFVAAVAAAARPTGLPSATQSAPAAQPEDVIVCIGAPLDDPAVTTTLRWFAGRIPAFGTERMGLTSGNRRVVPLTRDYQYAAAQFGGYATGQADGAPFVSPVSYTDYARNVEDLMALCLTGFPAFDEAAPQRRSLVYVGPQPTTGAGQLFTADRVREMAQTAGVQVNVITDTEGALDRLAAGTGGRSYRADANVASALTEIRQHPPEARVEGEAQVRSAETPDIPLLVALCAVLALSVLPLCRRRT